MQALFLFILGCSSEKEIDTAEDTSSELSSYPEEQEERSNSDDLDDNSEDDSADNSDNDSDDSSDDTGPEESSSSNGGVESDSEEASNSSCSTDQLLWEAAAEHATDPTLPLTSSSTIVLIGRVTNPCPSPIELTTPSTCLVGGGLLFGQDTHLWNNTCPLNSTQWSIPANSHIEEVEYFASPAAGFYELQIYFADSNAHNGLLTFNISP